jgi:transcriptional regulator with XRE-family HTH domain
MGLESSGGTAGDFAQQLRSLRQGQGLTILALARLVGVSKVTVWKWEKGDARPRARMIAPLAQALGVAPAALHGSGAAAHPAADLPAPGEGEGAEQLTEVIARAKKIIADASGASPQNITISIEY